LTRFPAPKRGEYILQERLNFTPVVATPHGMTKVELRIMYIWLDELLPGTHNRSHGPRPDDGRRSEQGHEMGGIVGGAGQQLAPALTSFSENAKERGTF
jgi:hypothetical protein